MNKRMRCGAPSDALCACGCLRSLSKELSLRATLEPRTEQQEKMKLAQVALSLPLPRAPRPDEVLPPLSVRVRWRGFLSPPRRMFFFLSLLASCSKFLRARSCSLMSCDASEYSRFRLSSEACPLMEVTIFSPLHKAILSAIKRFFLLRTVRLVFRHGGGLPDPNVLPCSSFGFLKVVLMI